MQQTTTPTLCMFCAVPMISKTVFGKPVLECPKCKRRVAPEAAGTTAPPDGRAAEQ